MMLKNKDILVLMINGRQVGLLSDKECLYNLIKLLIDNINYMHIDAIKTWLRDICEMLINVNADNKKFKLKQRLSNIIDTSEKYTNRGNLIAYVTEILLSLEGLGTLHGFSIDGKFNAEKQLIRDVKMKGM